MENKYYFCEFSPLSNKIIMDKKIFILDKIRDR